MKKFYLLFILICLSLTSREQIVLEHTFISNWFDIYYTQTYGYVYVTHGGNQPCEIYNSEFQLVKSINFDIGPNESFGQLFNVSDQLFNLDNKIEILYVTNSDQGQNLKIINEDGAYVFQAPSEGFGGIFHMPDGFKLITREDTLYYPLPDNWRVYSLPGSTILDVPEEVTQKMQSFSFPNPADNYINIRYPLGATEISVYNSNGTSIYNGPLKGSGTERISTNNYPNGCYMYTLKANQKEIGSGKFIVAR